MSRGSRLAWMFAPLALVAAAFAGWRWQRARRTSTQQLELGQVDRGPIVAKVTATGTVSAIVTVQVGSQVSGRVAALVIMVSATTPEGAARAQRQVTGLLRDRHHLARGVDDDFSIRNLSELASASQEGTRTLTLLLAAVAAVSLLVGGIGIMNIMLVSVTERTREIGIRMAVGAKPRDIRLQFLVEALALAVAGGCIGIEVGLGAAWRLAASFGWPVLFRPDVVAVAVGFSAAVGVGFGFYPATKAARLDPIQALRFE